MLHLTTKGLLITLLIEMFLHLIMRIFIKTSCLGLLRIIAHAVWDIIPQKSLVLNK